MQTITVQKGDTLSHIALRHLGSVARWPEVYEVNAAAMLAEQGRRYPKRPDRRGPDWIFEGQTLVVSALSEGEGQ